jgi:peptidoglycan/LPS O-acetylase OafA/YrhL
VLSGFLITGILLESRRKPHYYRHFYTRRALRILPAYYSLLILLAVLHESSAAFLGLSFVYLSNLASLFGASMGYGPLWSLSVEEHYYILWPTVVHKLHTRYLVVFLVLICAVVPIARGISFHTGHYQGLDSYTWFVADGLAIGSLMAILLRTPVSRNQLVALCALLLGVTPLVAIAGGPFGILNRQRLLGATLLYTVANLFFAGFLLLFLLLGTGPRKRSVNSSLLRFLGYISYGLYLIHMLAFRVYDRAAHRYWPQLLPSVGHFDLVVLRFAVAGGAAIVLAYLSRKYFEDRFLRLKDRVAATPKPLGRNPAP